MTTNLLLSDLEEDETSVVTKLLKTFEKNTTIQIMEARAEHQKQKNYLTIYSVCFTFGFGAFIMTLVWLVKYKGGFTWNSKPNQQFNWHPLLMLTGLILLNGQTILIYRTLINYPKKLIKLLHSIMHLIIFTLSVIGLKAAFDSHNYAQPPKPNLYTMHSWIGLTTIIIFTAQLIIGFFVFLYPGLSKTLRSFILPIHVVFGSSIYFMCLLTAVTGLVEKSIWSIDNYESLPFEGVLVNFLCIFITLYGIICMYLLNQSDYKRTDLTNEEIILTED